MVRSEEKRMEASIPDHVRENLSKLHEERELSSLSPEQLQKLSGVRADIIRAYENGTGTPTRSKYNKLAEFFGWEEWE